jgi:hypothetical protein
VRVRVCVCVFARGVTLCCAARMGVPASAIATYLDHSLALLVSLAGVVVVAHDANVRRVRVPTTATTTSSMAASTSSGGLLNLLRRRTTGDANAPPPPTLADSLSTLARAVGVSRSDVPLVVALAQALLAQRTQ